MDDRKAKADEKYRRIFYELGLDENFEYISFEGKDKIRLKCKRCGVEKLRTKCVFVGKQKKLFCRECGNGMLLFSPFVDEVLEFYADGHSLNETSERFDVRKFQLMDWVKRRKVSNGKSLTDDNAEKAKRAAQATLPAREKEFVPKVEARGFEYLGGFTRRDCFIRVKCKICGEISERSAQPFYDGVAVCANCKRQAALVKREKEKQERQEEKERKKVMQALINPLGLSPYQIERQKELDKKQICVVCGNAYTIRLWQALTGSQYVRASGYCSLKCQNEKKREYNREYKKKTGGDNNRKRARKYGCERCGEKINVKTYCKRYNLNINELFCAICGRKCNPNDNTWSKTTGPLKPSIDHIIPLHKGGGDVWENVQIACMYCNSKYGDKLKGGEAV